MDSDERQDDITMDDADLNRKMGMIVASLGNKANGPQPSIQGGKTPMVQQAKAPESPSSKQEPNRKKPISSDSTNTKSTAQTKTSDARLAGLPVGSRLAQ